MYLPLIYMAPPPPPDPNTSMTAMVEAQHPGADTGFSKRGGRKNSKCKWPSLLSNAVAESERPRVALRLEQARGVQEHAPPELFVISMPLAAFWRLLTILLRFLFHENADNHSMLYHLSYISLLYYKENLTKQLKHSLKKWFELHVIMQCISIN